MNLKESFRYQKFLDSMMSAAAVSVAQRSHCLKTTETHKRHAANPDADDYVKVVEDEVFFANDDVLCFMEWLVAEKEKLTIAIGEAKASVGFDIDAAVEANKFRQSVNSAVKDMLYYTPAKSVQQGRDYKFNVEGNQTPYVYEIEVSKEERYDKNKAKALMREMISKADSVSTAIDLAIINTQVDYKPAFDVNESFEDVMTEFLANRDAN